MAYDRKYGSTPGATCEVWQVFHDGNLIGKAIKFKKNRGWQISGLFGATTEQFQDAEQAIKQVISRSSGRLVPVRLEGRRRLQVA